MYLVKCFRACIHACVAKTINSRLNALGQGLFRHTFLHTWHIASPPPRTLRWGRSPAVLRGANTPSARVVRNSTFGSRCASRAMRRSPNSRPGSDVCLWERGEQARQGQSARYHIHVVRTREAGFCGTTVAAVRINSST